MTAQPVTTVTTAPPASRLRRRGHRISGWDPEDVTAWKAGGAKVARRNLIWSIFAEHIGFSVWSIWSVMVLFMPQNVYHIDAAGKFFLVAMPTLVGAVLRLPYTTAVARFGGRNWTIVSALLLLLPLILTWYFMLRPPTSYTTFMILAALAGFGGGNFASSMTNINAFYPQRLKGWALGLNAGGGNIGVPVIQLVGLLVIATAGVRRPELVCIAYLVLVVIAALGAALFMDNLDNQTSNGAAMLGVLRFSDSWVIAFLYIGTFGLLCGRSVTARRPNSFSRSTSRFAEPAAGRAAGRPDRRCEDHDVVLCRDGACRGGARRSRHPSRCPQRQDQHRHHGDLRRRVHRTVRHLRNRQRLRVQDDPVDVRNEVA
jgi:NNP family nitrate/nitrite transporter-like MFS transporter